MGDLNLVFASAMSFMRICQVVTFCIFKRKLDRRRDRFWQEIQQFRFRRIRSSIRKVLLLATPKPRKRRLWKKRRSTHWWDEIVPTFDNDRWIDEFRITKCTFDYICESVRPILSPDPNPVMPMQGLSVEKIVAIAVFKLSHVAEYQVVGNLFGVHKSTVHNCVYGFCLAVTYALGPELIKMPDAEEAKEIGKAFEKKCHLPQIVGAFDGSHILITPPTDGHNDFVNRKQFCSYVLQAIVDDKLLFRDISCKMPGSCHDATVLRESEFYRNLDAVKPRGFRNIDGMDIPYMLLGDPAYPLKSWLLKDYPYDNRITPEMDSFNVHLNKGRVVVEQAFGRLKARWRVLCKKSDIDYTFMPTVVATCCILHNLCEKRREAFRSQWLREVEMEEAQHPEAPVLPYDEENCPLAVDIRDHLRSYLSRNFEILSSIRGRYAAM